MDHIPALTPESLFQETVHHHMYRPFFLGIPYDFIEKQIIEYAPYQAVENPFVYVFCPPTCTLRTACLFILCFLWN